jgi:TolB protein
VKAVLAAAALAALFGQRDAAAQSRPIGMARQVTYSYNMDNSLSPDGRRMVFIRMIEGREQLFVMGTGGGGEAQITRDSADHEDPAWSPDGRSIAYVRIEGASKIVHVMRVDGSGDEAVTPPTQSAIHPSWTPDGARILYCTDDDLRPPVKNASEIYAVDLRTRKVATLISGGVNTFPVMSPDGRRILFRRMLGEMNSEVFVADADGSNPRNLTSHPSFEGWPSWSPDGARIAFAGNRNANYQIFLMEADGSNVRLLANTEGRATVPRWAPDGRTIYFTNCQKRDFGSACEIMAAPVEPAR